MSDVSREYSLIKVGFCVAYDWRMLERSLPLVYDTADRICLSLDLKRHSWNGHPFAFDEAAFRQCVSRIDRDGKIDVYEDDFYLPNLSPLENDTRQRQMMADRLRPGGWHVQLDVDEYVYDFQKLVAALRKIDRAPDGRGKPRCVFVQWVILYKAITDGWLYIDQPRKARRWVPVASNAGAPQHIFIRRTKGAVVHVPIRILHDSWARPPEELLQKLQNWGHARELPVQSIFALWQALDANNYQYLRDFNPFVPANEWPRLGFCAAGSFEELVGKFRSSPGLEFDTLGGRSHHWLDRWLRRR